MKNFGNKEEFAITYNPDLERYADDEDVIQNPDEYLLGGSICFWVKGKNLFAFRDWGPEATYGYYTLQFLVEFLTQNLADHLSEVLFPVETKATNAIDMCRETELDIEDTLEALSKVDWNNVDMELNTKIYEWMCPRSFSINNVGTFLPDLMVRRVGDKIELSWNNRHPHSDGENKFFMLHTKGVEYIDAELYRDVIIQFCWAYSNHIQKKHPDLANRYRKNLQKAMNLNRFFAA